MSFTRRALLRALPALPLAGNEIKRRAAELAGAGVLGNADAALTPQGVAICAPEDNHWSIVRFLRSLNGLPKWKIREIRNQARQTRQLDPDIASLRSISLAAAMQMQWRRNEDRLARDTIGWHEYAAERKEWLKEKGVPWI